MTGCTRCNGGSCALGHTLDHIISKHENSSISNVEALPIDLFSSDHHAVSFIIKMCPPCQLDGSEFAFQNVKRIDRVEMKCELFDVS